MPHTSSRCSSASRWKGQLVSAIFVVRLTSGHSRERRAPRPPPDACRPVPRARRADRVPPPLSSAPAACGGRPEAIGDRCAGLRRRGDGGGEQLTGEVVVTFRDGSGEFVLARSVQLRRPTCPGPVRPVVRSKWTSTTPASASLSRWKAGHRAGHTERFSGLVPGGPPLAGRQEGVELAPQGLVEGRDLGNAPVGSSLGSISAV